MPYRGEQSVGGMAMAEFDGQRMHRDTSVETTTAGFAEVAPPRPHAHSWATQHVRAFPPSDDCRMRVSLLSRNGARRAALAACC